MTSISKTIITHNGCFHFDEVTAYTILNKLYPNNNLVRTRDQTIIDTGDIVIDVGQVYNHETGRYDHHQSSFKETFDQESQITLSSAGLIYKHYGKDLIKQFLKENEYYCGDGKGCEEEYNIFHCSDEKYNIDKAHKDIYYLFFAEIDAFDNGIRQYSDNFYDSITNKTIKQKFIVHLTLAQTVSKCNGANLADHQKQHHNFRGASNYVWSFLSIVMLDYFRSENQFVNDLKHIETSIENRYKTHPSGKIIVCENDCNSWRKCLQMCENKDTSIKIEFICYKNSNETWNVRAVSDIGQLFKNRRNLLPEDEIKLKVTKPEEIIFVHNKLFIGGAKTVETTIEMASASLNIVS